MELKESGKHQKTARAKKGYAISPRTRRRAEPETGQTSGGVKKEAGVVTTLAGQAGMGAVDGTLAKARFSNAEGACRVRFPWQI